jgi:hypothetical protein
MVNVPINYITRRLTMTTQYYIKRQREIKFSQTKELEEARAQYLEQCEAIRQKYQTQHTLLKIMASPAAVGGPQ